MSEIFNTHVVERRLADDEGDPVPAVPDQVDDVVPGGARLPDGKI